MSIVNRVLCALKLQKYVDARTLSRISGVCLDFLVVAAVSSIRLDVIVDHAMSMLLISIAALASMLFYFYWLAPRVFSEDWFEQAIVHFGVNTGVTAVGFMLLRVATRTLSTLGSKAYADSGALHQPAFGGDIVTALIPMAIVDLRQRKGRPCLARHLRCLHSHRHAAGLLAQAGQSLQKSEVIRDQRLKRRISTMKVEMIYLSRRM